MLEHLAAQGAVHPERLFEKLISLAGELSTFDRGARRAKDYGGYRHDDPKRTFADLVLDI